MSCTASCDSDRPSRAAAAIPRQSYLANGETLKLDSTRCTGCGACLEVCPHAVLARDSADPRRRVRIAEPGRCMECGACVQNCPAKALEVAKGVGCVAAIVRGKLTGSAPSCDCSGPSDCC